MDKGDESVPQQQNFHSELDPDNVDVLLSADSASDSHKRLNHFAKAAL